MGISSMRSGCDRVARGMPNQEYGQTGVHMQTATGVAIAPGFKGELSILGVG
jgi:hypothetical protein